MKPTRLRAATVDLQPRADLWALSGDELLRQANQLQRVILDFDDQDRPTAWRAYDARVVEHVFRKVAAIPQG